MLLYTTAKKTSNITLKVKVVDNGAIFSIVIFITS